MLRYILLALFIGACSSVPNYGPTIRSGGSGIEEIERALTLWARFGLNPITPRCVRESQALRVDVMEGELVEHYSSSGPALLVTEENFIEDFIHGGLHWLEDCTGKGVDFDHEDPRVWDHGGVYYQTVHEPTTPLHQMKPGINNTRILGE